MKIGIIDADLLDNGTWHPNLALMKINGYYKKQNNEVKLLKSYENLKKVRRKRECLKKWIRVTRIN